MVKLSVPPGFLNKVQYSCSDSFERNYLSDHFESLVKEFISNRNLSTPQEFEDECGKFINERIQSARDAASIHFLSK